MPWQSAARTSRVGEDERSRSRCGRPSRPPSESSVTADSQHPTRASPRPPSGQCRDLHNRASSCLSSTRKSWPVSSTRGTPSLARGAHNPLPQPAATHSQRHNPDKRRHNRRTVGLQPRRPYEKERPQTPDPAQAVGALGTDHCTWRMRWSYGRPCTFFMAASASCLSSNDTNPNPLHNPVSMSRPT